MKPDPVDQVREAAARKLFLAQLAIFWERLWPAMWPAVFVSGLFVCATLIGFWQRVPGIPHLALLLLFGAALLAELIRGFKNFRMPEGGDGRRRIELASGFKHRPLSVLVDRLALPGDDADAREIWQVHQTRMAENAQKNLRVGYPSPCLARRDPLGLRAALFLAMFVAFIAGIEDADEHFAYALAPELTVFGAVERAELSVSLTPPAYTGQAPIFLTPTPLADASSLAGQSDEPIPVPARSALMARVHGGDGIPSLTIDTLIDSFTVVDKANFEIAATIDRGDRILVTQGGETLGDWPITVVPDRPPSVAFSKPPFGTYRLATKLDYVAEDDYGVGEGRAIFELAGGPGDSMELALNLGRTGTQSSKGTSYYDLTPHPWAGLPVTIRLEVVDGAGQWGSSEPADFVLPARSFAHPVARAVVDERRKLAMDPNLRPNVAVALDEISKRSAEYDENLGVFLALRLAYAQLVRHADVATIDQVQDLLWQVALAIEEGPLALAEQTLRSAVQALMEALGDDKVGDAELDQQIDELRRAIDEFLTALAQQALQQPGLNPPQPGQQSADRNDLHELLDQARDLARTGSRDAAQDLLSQLQEFLESLQGGSFAGMPMDGEMEQGMESLQNLEDLIGQQEQLLDQTFRQGQRQPGGMGQGGQSGGHGNQPQGSTKPSANQQEALRQMLRDLMLDMADGGISVPRELGQAEKSMGRAGRALNQGQPRRATRPQTEAIDQMQQGAQSMLESLMSAFEESASGTQLTSGPFSSPRDPFGRGMGKEASDDGTVRIPDKNQLERSRAILKELYRRAGQRSRPQTERDYIDRLLRRFP